jgi:signal transduction histidine kinase
MTYELVTESRGLEKLVLGHVEERLRTALHEIRQPVAAVLALAEAARGLRGATADVRGYLDLIIAQVQEVSNAAWSVLDRDSMVDLVDSHLVDLDEVVESVLAAYTCTWTGTVTRRGHRGRLVISGTRPAVRRCLVNVVDNAVRAAGPTGAVVVTVEPGADSVRVVIDDDGPGFGRVPRGTGIGLTETRRELREFGGALSPGLRSDLGGARVALSLPLRPSDPTDITPAAAIG